MSAVDWIITRVEVVVGIAALFYFLLLILTFLGLIGDNAKELLGWIEKKFERVSGRRPS